MENYLLIMLPLSICIILHEAGHYYAARYYDVGARRVSLFFNALATLLKYDPASGRISFISRQITIPIRRPDGSVVQAGGEWALLSFPISKAYAPDSYYDSQSDMIYPCRGILFCKEVVKLRLPEELAKWRKTQYCIGWIPCGGYVTLKQGTAPGCMGSLKPMQRFVINAAGVACNLLTMVLALTVLRLISGAENPALNFFNAEVMWVAYMSYGLLWLNILPIPGLDGGAMARNLAGAILRRFHTSFAQGVVKFCNGIYNLLSWLIFFFIISTWLPMRGSFGFERVIYRFFNNIFQDIISLWGF